MRLTVISIIALLLVLVPIGMPKADGQEVDTSAFRLYEEPFVVHFGGEEVLLEQGSVNNEAKKYAGLEEVVTLLGGEIRIFEEKVAIDLPEKNLFRFAVEEVEVSPYVDPLVFDEVINADAAVIIEDTPNGVLFAKNEEERLFPASTTKIMTALLALEHGELSDKVVVSEAVTTIPWDSSKANLRPGDVLTLEQLLYAMMIPSGNDAAVAVAVHIAGSVEQFAKMMNEKAKEIGASHTNFVNPHGYHHEDQYTTALDLAKIAYEAAQHPAFSPLVSTFSYRASYVNQSGQSVERTWRATNQQINPKSAYYSANIIGGKTGYTRASRHTLVSFAEKEHYQYITVILKGDRNARYADTERLVNRAIEVRSAFNEERSLIVDLFTKDCTVSVNGKEVALETLFINSDEEIYISFDELVKVMEELKHRFIREKQLNIALDHIYFPNKHFLRSEGNLLMPIRSTFAAYQIASMFDKEAGMERNSAQVRGEMKTSSLAQY